MTAKLLLPKLPLLLLFGLIATALSAQTATLDYGFKAGLNLAQHYAPNADETEYEVGTSMRTGLIAGAWLDLRILPQFALGYELLYSQKGSREQILVKKLEGEPEPLQKPAVMNVDYDLDYLEIPVLLKVKTLEAGAISLEAIAGTAFGYRVKGRHQLKGTLYLPITTTPDPNDFDEMHLAQSSKLKYVNRFDYSMVYGTALRYSGKVRLSAEFRFTLGWDYLQLPTFSMDDVKVEPVELRNQTYSAILGIEF